MRKNRVKKITAMMVTATLLTTGIYISNVRESAYAQTGAYEIDENSSNEAEKQLMDMLEKGYTDEGEKLVYTEKEMLDEIVDNRYMNGDRMKYYIVKSKDDNLDFAYWKGYASAKCDVDIGFTIRDVSAIVKIGDDYYHSICMIPRTAGYDEAVKRAWDEYDIRVRDIEQEIGLMDGYLNGNLCDAQKVMLIYQWAAENRNDENFNKPEIAEHLGEDCGQTAQKAALYNDAACAGWSRLMNRFCHDVGVDCYYIYNEGHQWNLHNLNDGKYYTTDLYDCQMNKPFRDEEYYTYESSGMKQTSTSCKDSINNITQINKQLEISQQYFGGEGSLCGMSQTYDNGTFTKHGIFADECDYCNKIHTYPMSETHHYGNTQKGYLTDDGTLLDEQTCNGYEIRRECLDVGCDETVTYSIPASHSYMLNAYGNVIELKCSDCDKGVHLKVEEETTPEETTPETEQNTTLNETEFTTPVVTEAPSESETPLESEAGSTEPTTQDATSEQNTSDAPDESESSSESEVFTSEIKTEKKTEESGSEKVTPKATDKNSTTIKQSTTVNTVKQPARPKITAKNKKGKKIKVSWKKIKDATKYQVKAVCGKTIITKNVKKTKVSYTLKKLKKNKKYKIYVRAYNKAGWSKWSKKKTVKVKK